MNLKKICMICDVNVGTFSCGACGRLVCGADFDAEKKMCSGCVGGLR